ncbi:hypothetical protein [Agromyces sp. NPDC049794]|uniref:hypothetical protein n=1 Tax=unclassified Agromyces TaxID=2639701 RepID=UPI0033C2EA69
MTDAAGSAIARARELLTQTAEELRSSGARQEALAEFVSERRVLGIPRAARMTPVGRVWRLGVLLLDDDATLYATGRVVRAERPARKSVTAESVAQQRAFRAAAAKGGIPEGETVNFHTTPIDLDELGRDGASGPLVLDAAAGEVRVRWSPSQPDALTPLDAYLRDRADLLAHPPEGA